MPHWTLCFSTISSNSSTVIIGSKINVMDLNTGEIVTNTEILTNNCILKNKHSLTLKAKSNPNIHIELLFGFRNQAD